MNAEYIERQLIGHAVPKEIIGDAVYFMTNYGWRKGPMGNIYILGVERGRWDYYWICFTEKKEIRYISCCCKIDHEIIENTESKLSEEDRDFILEQVTNLVVKENKQILTCMFTIDDELEYDKETPVIPENTKVNPAAIHETEELANKKTWTNENLKDSMKDELMKYAIDKLNETKPLVIKMSQIETLRYNAFQEKHRKCVSGKMGAIGGGVSLKVTGTGLGWCFDCICNGCGEKEDITDISQW